MQRPIPRAVLLTCVLLAGAGRARAQLDLTPAAPIDVSELGFNSIGGLAFDDATGRLWLADAWYSNQVASVDPDAGVVLGSFSASAVPGLALGPDALALAPSSGNLLLYSVFTEDDAGYVTQAGVYVGPHADPHHCAALAFDATGRLFGIEDSQTGSGNLHELDPATGLLLSDVPLAGYDGRIAAADVDPLTGRIVAYADADDSLLEIDPATGLVLSATDVSRHVLGEGFAAGLAFDDTGERLYLGRGTGLGADTVLVFARAGAGSAFCFGDGSGSVCPCGNHSAPDAGEGCVTSSGVGARVSTAGGPSVATDDLRVLASQLPPSQAALLFAGTRSVAGGAGLAFGDGLRCAGGAVVRLGVRVPDAAGAAAWGPGLGALGGWQAGDARALQVWFRDPLAGPCGTGFNLSNGILWTFSP